MVKLRQYFCGSGEALDHDVSFSAGALPDELKTNGDSLKAAVVNGNLSEPKVLFTNRNSNRVPTDESPLVNGSCSSVSSNEITTGDGYRDKICAKVTSVNVNLINKMVVNDFPVIPTLNGKNNDKSSDSSVNGTNTPTKNGSYSNNHTIDSLCNEYVSDENQHGFIVVVNKKKRKNKNRNRKKPISNLPPARNAENNKRDNGNDNDSGPKTILAQLMLQPSTRNSAAVRNSEKSYSSVLVNGQNGTRISQLRNGGPNIFSSQKVTKCTESNTVLNNTKLSGTHISVDHLSDNLKIQDLTVADVSAQTEVCSEKETSSNRNDLPVHEEGIHVPEKMSSPSDYVDVEERSDESSTAAYCDSVGDLHDVDGSEVELENGDLHDVQGSEVQLENGELCEAEGSNLELYNAELYGAGGSNLEYYHDWNGADCVGSFYGDKTWMGNIVSNDSGRGDSEITYDGSMPYCCEFPREKTSQLIGKGGNFKYEIERKSGIKLWVYSHEYDKNLSIVCMTGTGAQIEKAKELIKERFRHVTLRQWLGFNPVNPPLSEKYLPILPEGTDFMGVVSCICDPNFFWVQQYGHPHLYSLEDLERRISEHFNTVPDAPGIENPAIGSVIAVPGVRDGDNVKWIRGWVINIIPEDGNVVVRYLDHGGDHLVPVSNIRPMRHDFFSMPFFAAQCCLYDILPTGGVWSDEALAEFTRLCNSSTCPPIVRVMYRTPECYYVTMFGYDSEINAQVDIASHLVTKGFGVRPCLPATEFRSELQQ